MSSPKSTSSSTEADVKNKLVLQRDHILRDIFEHIEDFKELLDVAPLKEQVIGPVLDHVFDPEVQMRGMLRALRHTSEFKASLDQVNSPELKGQINAFIEGKSASEVFEGQSFVMPTSHRHTVAQGKPRKASFLEKLKNLLFKALNIKSLIMKRFSSKDPKALLHELPRIYEDEARTKLLEVHLETNFENWGQTVKNTPRYTFLPTTVLGVQNLVRYAVANNLRVRCAGYRHSWSSVFSQENEILVSFVNLDQVTTLPDPMSIIPGDYAGTGVAELKTIELKEQLGDKKRLCRIGVGVTNEDFRRWAVANRAWALPVDVILVEVTIGGVNGPICHGAGRRHQTCSDGVRRIEYVDCRGDLQAVDDPELIKAAAGSFGLLGVVTHITFELDAMTWAVMEPRKTDIGLAIPPLDKHDIPAALRAAWFSAPDADEKLEVARRDFERRAAEDYYSEWFWFTYQQKAWVNTWNTSEVEPPAAAAAAGGTVNTTVVADYPSDAGVFLQWVEGWIGGVLTSSRLFNAIPGPWQAQLLATMGMAALPPTLGESETPTINTLLPNALHFRRGIQNMRVRDMEFQIPIPPRADDPALPDFSIVRRAWWDAIRLVYAYEDGSAPMRLTLELRIMGGSDVLMAPQHGNGPWGTASIEVLTLPDTVADDEWRGFMQRVADKWMGYADAEGRRLNVRPHWAKEWEGLVMGGVDAREYLRTVAYKEQIPKFRGALAKIGDAQGWGLEDLRARFSNELWDKMIFEE
ncbi:hypothetical protein F4778DRAFT_781225 [Xylariomycetidae sp. FL2044]|nr:hypothetical protein F4778DRAFT_781225 [Xylariomycetidae sp. FL2044]